MVIIIRLPRTTYRKISLCPKPFLWKHFLPLSPLCLSGCTGRGLDTRLGLLLVALTEFICGFGYLKLNANPALLMWPIILTCKYKLSRLPGVKRYGAGKCELRFSGVIYVFLADPPFLASLSSVYLLQEEPFTHRDTARGKKSQGKNIHQSLTTFHRFGLQLQIEMFF